jgi:hypothetical protein
LVLIVVIQQCREKFSVIEELLEYPEVAELEYNDTLTLGDYIKSSDHKYTMINVSTMFNIISYIMQIQ